MCTHHHHHHHSHRNINILQVFPSHSQYQDPLVRAIWTTPCSVRTKSVSFLVLFNDEPFSEWTKHWSWSEGVYMPSWMQYQIFSPLFLLQLLNLFWYYLMIRILIRLSIFFFTYLSLTKISGLYARLILMMIDRMTRMKMTNRTELYRAVNMVSFFRLVLILK